MLNTQQALPEEVTVAVLRWCNHQRFPAPIPVGRLPFFGSGSKVAVTVGKDARNNPEFLLEKLGGFDFASMAGDGAGGGGGKGLEALGQLKQTLAKVR